MPLTLFSSRRNNLKLIRHRLVAYLLDCCAFALSGLLAFELRFDGALPAKYLHPMGAVLCVWVVAKSAAFVVAKLDRGTGVIPRPTMRYESFWRIWPDQSWAQS